MASKKLPVGFFALTIILLMTSTTRTKASQSKSNSSEAVDDILKDTISLLDVLDQKLARVANSTPNALMRDNLRLLHGPQLLVSSPETTKVDESAAVDEALMRLAEGFASGRKKQNNDQDDLQTAASSSSPEKFAQPLKQQTSELITKRTFSAKRARYLQPASSAGTGNGGDNQDSNQQLASDSTERHIKFTLDLMQAIFASQLYSAKTNLIESFLISPLSIQTVLMMMHLGARGQTRRELASCLHLQLPVAAAETTRQTEQATASQQDKLIKRRHQQAVSGDSKPSSGKPQNNHQRQQQSSSPQQISNAAHELFGGAVRNLLKDQIVTKALTSANQIFLQKNLPLSQQYDWSIRHYYGADVKLVDFQHQQSGSSPSSALTNGSVSSPSQTPSSSSPQQPLQQPDKAKQLDSHQQPATNQSAANNSNADQSNLQQMINDWVERQTRGKISNFLSSPISTSTLMMAINVLFFKGDWQYKFDPSDTEQEAWFTQANGKVVKMPMMVNRLPLAFAHDPQMKVSVIELPYKAQRLGLFLLLPDEISGIFQLMQSLNSTSFANLISSMRKPNQAEGIQQSSSNGINVRIPKFSIDSSPRLSQILTQQLGLKTLFTPDVADLSGIFASSTPNKRSSSSNSNNSTISHNNFDHNHHGLPPQVGLDELLHKAVLQIDEQGSVAAASSATIVERVGLFNNNYFEADHPFLLFLMDKQTGLVLFSGAFAGNSATGSSSSSGSSNQPSQSATSSGNNTATPN